MIINPTTLLKKLKGLETLPLKKKATIGNFQHVQERMQGKRTSLMKKNMVLN